MDDLYAAYLAINTLKDVTKQEVINSVTSGRSLLDILAMSPDAMLDIGLSLKVAFELSALRVESYLKDVEALRRLGGGLLVYEDERFPKLLKQIYDPPVCLHYLGKIDCLNELSLSLVGSRRVSKYGEEMGKKLSGDLASCGVTIVSGFAYGVDITSHIAAFTSGGSTVAVLGSGFFNIYPKAHSKYINNICDKGCLITEFPLDEQPNGYNFPKRNRIISGLSQGVVVVEASLKSGSLITVRMALEQGRDVFAVPVSPLYTNNATNQLIRNGAILVQSAEDILAEYYPLLVDKVSSAKTNVENLNEPPADPVQADILSMLKIEPLAIEEIVDKSSEEYVNILSAITILELNGLIERGEDYRYYPKR